MKYCVFTYTVMVKYNSDFSYSNGYILVFLFDFFMFFVLAPNFYQILFSFLIVHITILEVLKKSYLFLKVCHLSNSFYKRNIFPSASINEIRMNYQKIKVYFTNCFLKTWFFKNAVKRNSKEKLYYVPRKMANFQK